MKKIEALKMHLEYEHGVKPNAIGVLEMPDNEFQAEAESKDFGVFVVLTEKERFNMAKQGLIDNLYELSPAYLAYRMPDGIDEALIERICELEGEGANEIIRLLISHPENRYPWSIGKNKFEFFIEEHFQDSDSLKDEYLPFDEKHIVQIDDEWFYIYEGVHNEHREAEIQNI